MKPVLFAVSPTQKSAEFVRPVPQPQVSTSLTRPVFEDLDRRRVIFDAR